MKEKIFILIGLIVLIVFTNSFYHLAMRTGEKKQKEIESEKYKNANGKITVVLRYPEEYPINTDSIQYIDNNCIKVLDTQINNYRVFCGNFQIEYFNK